MFLAPVQVFNNLLIRASKMDTPTYGFKFVNVHDVAAAFVAEIRAPGRSPILFAVSGERSDIKEAIEDVARFSGRS
jgi:hypothetical protein